MSHSDFMTLKSFVSIRREKKLVFIPGTLCFLLPFLARSLSCCRLLHLQMLSYFLADILK